MSNNKMLIDAAHPEETRVVVLRNGRVEEFDYESAARKLLRGNIYLAKVTRVEPSLQAAFVDYGGNRHGFLAFNEIHPDYYQIPVADRQALIDEDAAAEAEEEAEADARAEALSSATPAEEAQPAEPEGEEEAAIDVTALLPPEPAAGEAEAGESEPRVVAAEAASDPAITAEAVVIAEEPAPAAAAPAAAAEIEAIELSDVPEPIGNVEDVGVEEVETVENGGAAPEQVESVGSEDALEELPSRPRRRPRSYKIQEVIKRRQIILVQVVKEERGTKGAALTTYLSLAGRYTVLMPNTARGGGISRKITNVQDRKRLKAIAEELEVPEGMGLIIRTAGAARTKQEIKRDFEYLLRLWESVRDLTLHSTAPSLVYEEGDLIKRSIRDLYTKDVDEIVVAGEPAFKEAKDFMRMLMPSHAKNVIRFDEPEPLFTRFQIERQLNAMFSPYVHLKSGGYLVINQTEALVAIDVNSGKATREFSIEETALNTNLEASDEIARQLKLRDLAGLIVIDFIDMEEKRNNRAVERRLKEALRHDRARIQVGRISHFGLMEMSRQRLRTGVLEGSTTQCPHCQGTGIIRSVESVALAVLRGIEDALMNDPRGSITATTTAQVALYVLNNKRSFINDMEARSGVSIAVQASDKIQGANFTIERGARPLDAAARRAERTAVNMDWGFDSDSEAGDVVEEIEVQENGEDSPRDSDSNGRGRRRRRGRRGERGEGRTRMAEDDRTGDTVRPEPADEHRAVEADDDAEDEGAEAEDRGESVDRSGDEGGEGRRRGRRRGRRGGRRGRDRDRSPLAGKDQREDLTREAQDDDEQPPAADVPLTTIPDVETPAGPADEPATAIEDAPTAPEPVAAVVPPPMDAARPTLVTEAAEAPEPAADDAPTPVEAEEPDVPVVPPAAALAPRPAPFPAAPDDARIARTTPTASEPVVASVIVKTDGTAAVEDAKPARRGWWSRG